MINEIHNKNPFDIMIGLLLKYYRREKQVSTKEVSEKLNSGHSLYRLIESGNTPLHPSKTFLFIELFSDLIDDDDDIEFARLSNFLIGGQYVDSLVNRVKRKNSRGLTYKEAINELLDFDTVGFNKLFSNIQGLFDKKTKKEEMEYLINERVPLEVFDFLSKTDYTEEKSKQLDNKITELINNQYGLNLEIGIQMFKNLNTIHPSHISTIASEWEGKNKHNFEYSRGYFMDRDIIINEDNFTLFNYDYLFEDNFIKTELVFLKDKNNSSELQIDLKREFIKTLNSTRKKNKVKTGEIKEDSKQWNKIEIRLIEENAFTKHTSFLVNSPQFDRNNTSSLRAFWFFSMNSGNEIGFAGYRNSKTDTDYVLNLTLGETRERKEKFQELWGQIN